MALDPVRPASPQLPHDPCHQSGHFLLQKQVQYDYHPKDEEGNKITLKVKDDNYSKPKQQEAGARNNHSKHKQDEDDDDFGYHSSDSPPAADVTTWRGSAFTSNIRHCVNKLQVRNIPGNISRVDENPEPSCNTKMQERKPLELKRKCGEKCSGECGDAQTNDDKEESVLEARKLQKLLVELKIKSVDSESSDCENIEVAGEPEQILFSELDPQVLRSEERKTRDSEGRRGSEGSEDEDNLKHSEDTDTSAFTPNTDSTSGCLVSPKVHERLWCCTNGHFRTLPGVFSEFESNCGCTTHNLVDWGTRVSWCSLGLRHQYKVREVTYASPYRATSNPYITRVNPHTTPTFTTPHPRDSHMQGLPQFLPSLSQLPPLQQPQLPPPPPSLQPPQLPPPPPPLHQQSPAYRGRIGSVGTRKKPRSPNKTTSATAGQVKEEMPQSAPSTEGDRVFVCDQSGCKRTFSRNEELIRHVRIHSGNRPFLCQKCGRGFVRRDHLSKHQRTHLPAHVKRTYTCPIHACTHSYTRSDALTRHMWTAHHIRARQQPYRTQNRTTTTTTTTPAPPPPAPSPLPDLTPRTSLSTRSLSPVYDPSRSTTFTPTAYPLPSLSSSSHTSAGLSAKNTSSLNISSTSAGPTKFFLPLLPRKEPYNPP